MNARFGVPHPEIDRAYRWCAEIARRHYENFPVASFLLPHRMRPAVAAIYAFARRADDFADEPGPSADERLRLLDDWGLRLRARVLAGSSPAESFRPKAEADAPSGGFRLQAEDDLIFIALGDAIDRHQLPVDLLDDLLSAFRQDVTKTRYTTWADVLDYCSRSANPVGRLVLRVAGHDDPLLDRQSDAICTALQLTNFWQDFGIDWRRGRLYLPEEDRDRNGADERDLDAGRWTASWQRAMHIVVSRTRELLAAGRPLCDNVPGRLRWELRMTWHGGSRILDKVERSRDLLNHRPHLTAADVPLLLGRTAIWH